MSSLQEAVQAGSGLADAQLAVEDELQSELDLTAGKKDVFLVDVSVFIPDHTCTLLNPVCQGRDTFPSYNIKDSACLAELPLYYISFPRQLSFCVTLKCRLKFKYMISQH